jgi:flap endonuclease-1
VGTTLGNIIDAKAILLSDLSGKKIAIDAFNSLYAFLSIIRQPDGSLLTDRQGRVTSHLSGLLFRNIILIENGIHPVYVFDGKPSKLKQDELERRREFRDKAEKQWKRALTEGRMEDAYKLAQASSRLTTEMIEESKRLLSAMGIPIIQAPSEGEALAAQMAREGLVWASASQDNDSLLYNCPRMIRNLVGRRVPRSKKQKEILPELIELDQNLRRLKITREQLIDLAILVGTDYNAKVPGVGQKTALKLIKEHGTLEKIVSETDITVDFPYQEIRAIFLKPEKMEVREIELSQPDFDDLTLILSTEHDFNLERVKKAIRRLENATLKIKASREQKTMTDFFS